MSTGTEERMGRRRRRRSNIFVQIVFVCVATALVGAVAGVIALRLSNNTHTAQPQESAAPPPTVSQQSPTEDGAESPAAPTDQPNSPPLEQSKFKERGTLDNSALTAAAGKAYYKIVYLNDNTGYSYGGSEKTPSASVIKLFIMQHVFQQAEKGAISMDDSIGGRSISSLVNSMIQNSDNNATNQLIDKFGMPAINASIQQEGYTDTVLARRMLDFDARARGAENYTSVEDVVSFLETIYNNRTAYPYKEMLDIMKGQKIRTKIPLYLPATAKVASKTGELDVVENDVGIVFSDSGDFIIAAFTNNVSNPSAAREAIARLAKQALEHQ